MRYLIWLRLPISVMAVILASRTGVSCGGEPAFAAEPCAHLYDAPEPSALRLVEPWQPQQSGWCHLEEDDTAHPFAGCPVLVNDKLVAVLRKDSPDVDLYARRGQEVPLCARLQPLCDGTAGLQRTALDIQANAPDAVALEAGFRSPGGESRRITYELTAGAPFIKTTVSGGVDKLRVYALKGRQTSLLWCRDKENTWQAELHDGRAPEELKDVTLPLKDMIPSAGCTARAYDPWKKAWTVTSIEDGAVRLPPFARSVILRIRTM